MNTLFTIFLPIIIEIIVLFALAVLSSMPKETEKIKKIKYVLVAIGISCLFYRRCNNKSKVKVIRRRRTRGLRIVGQPVIQDEPCMCFTNRTSAVI